MRRLDRVARATAASTVARRNSSSSAPSARLLDSILDRVARSIPRVDDDDDRATTSSAPTFAVGLSGGVDSAVAAWALKRAGARVVGALMRNWDEANEDAGDERECSYVEDRKFARECAEMLRLDDFVELDFRREYWLDVFEPYVEAFESGATPNPDLECNRRVKFGALLRRATETIGAEYLATGHYARIDRSLGVPRLMRGIDETKDQSYFLASVSADALARACFPLGETLKTEVRDAARALGLPCAERRSSAGICFIGRKPFGDFIGEYIEPKRGAFVDVETGRDVPGAPPHRGSAAYTVGQRAKIGGASKPWFVVGKDAATNVVYVASGADHDALFSTTCAATDAFWVSGAAPRGVDVGARLLAKTRYASPLTPVIVRSTSATDDPMIPSRYSSSYRSRESRDSSSSSSSFVVEFLHPERAVTPGQALVLYDGDVCLGGGVVERVGPSLFESNARV